MEPVGEALSFKPLIISRSISFVKHIPDDTYFYWKGEPSWKNDFLERTQKRFYAEGYTKEQVKLIVAQTLQESGVNLRAQNTTPREHSLGIWQLNTKAMDKPGDFLHPDDNIAFKAQLDWFVDRTNHHKRQGRPSFECVIVAHNAPNAKRSWNHNLCLQSGYFQKVLGRLDELTTNPS